MCVCSCLFGFVWTTTAILTDGFQNNRAQSFSLTFLPNDKILDVTKLKAFADDTSNVARIMIFLLDRVENTVGKGENAGYQHFLLFPLCFPEPSSLRWSKVGIV